MVGEAANGVRLSTGPLMIVEQLPDDNPQKAVAMAYKKEYEQTFDDRVSRFGAHAYDALMIAVGAIKRAGSADRAAVRDSIENTSGYVGIEGIYTMSPTDHLGVGPSAAYMAEVRDGQFKLLHQ